MPRWSCAIDCPKHQFFSEYCCLPTFPHFLFVTFFLVTFFQASLSSSFVTFWFNTLFSVLHRSSRNRTSLQNMGASDDNNNNFLQVVFNNFDVLALYVSFFLRHCKTLIQFFFFCLTLFSFYGYYFDLL